MNAKIANERRQKERSKFEAHLNLYIHYLCKQDSNTAELEEAIGLAFVNYKNIPTVSSDVFIAEQDEFDSEEFEDSDGEPKYGSSRPVSQSIIHLENMED